MERMAPQPRGSGVAPNWWHGDTASPCSKPEIDGHLAGAGYRVRSSDLSHVAQSLERLESAMVSENPADNLATGAVHYNPSDLTSWVDSMLSDFSPTAADPPPRHPTPIPGTWTDQMYHHENQPQQMSVVAVVRQMEEEEDSGIRLVHLLMNCADSVQRGHSELAGSLIEEMRLVLARVNKGFGIGKVAGYFVDALCRRLYSPRPAATSGGTGSAVENEILYHHFYEACPYLKFAHFTANQAILEAFDGQDRVHVIDFNLMHGLQWPALIQALALRPGGPPFLRLTGIGPPSSDGRDTLREVGLRLAELARSVHVPFTFRGLAASRLDDVRPWMLQTARGETVAVNSVLQLHRLLGDHSVADADAIAPIDSVLGWIAGLKPKILTVVEQEADHNKPDFLDRFTEALFYYSTIFDSMEGGRGATGAAQQQHAAAAVAEVYLQRELSNIVCCEGEARVERHEPLANWRARLGRAGLSPVHLGSNAFKQASMLLTLFSGEGYCVEEVDGCLTLGWHSRPLISASAWQGAFDDVAPPDNDAPRNGNNINNEEDNGGIVNINNRSSSSSNSNYSNPRRQHQLQGQNIIGM